jgi:phage/conjugal plasmid C-4 type zinc finger TraR family protein
VSLIFEPNNPNLGESGELDRSSDPLDEGTQLAERERAYALAAIRQRSQSTEPPDDETDEHGVYHRYCLQCGDEIPAARLKSVPFAVRCVPCLTKIETEQRIANGKGGVREYGD